MKFTRIALASLALTALAGHAQAQLVTRISGATATSNNYLVTLKQLCTGTATGYKQSTTSSLGNRFTVRCSVPFTGTTTQEAQFDVTGGSINSVRFSVGAVGSDSATASFVRSPLNAGGTAFTGVPTCSSSTTDNHGVAPTTIAFTRGCSVTSGLQSDGGFTDVEPAVFTASGVLANEYTAEAATFSQVFGVAVSPALYTALQGAQGLGSCAPADSLACQPSISRAKLTALMNNNDFNEAKNLGPKFLVPGTTETNITYCRRPETSGTQASAQLYFLASPTASATGLNGQLFIHGPSIDQQGLTEVVDNGTGNTYTVFVASGSSNVKDCLSGVTAINPTTGFAFGVLSGENRPYGLTAANEKFKYVKISGAGFAEGTASGLQKAAAIAGDYDFVYESFLFNPTGNALLSAMNTQLDVANNTGLYPKTASTFGRGGNNNTPLN